MDIAKYWKTIVDTLQDGLMVVDPRGTIIAANPAAERVTGYKADELIGQSCRILNCTGCKIVGSGAGKHWCALFSKGTIKGETVPDYQQGSPYRGHHQERLGAAQRKG
jgi:two-component system response regulator HydG